MTAFRDRRRGLHRASRAIGESLKGPKLNNGRPWPSRPCHFVASEKPPLLHLWLAACRLAHADPAACRSACANCHPVPAVSLHHDTSSTTIPLPHRLPEEAGQGQSNCRRPLLPALRGRQGGEVQRRRASVKRRAAVVSFTCHRAN